MSRLTVIIPSFNEEDNIENTAKEISSVLDEAGVDFDLLFVYEILQLFSLVLIRFSL